MATYNKFQQFVEDQNKHTRAAVGLKQLGRICLYICRSVAFFAQNHMLERGRFGKSLFVDLENGFPHRLRFAEAHERNIGKMAHRWTLTGNRFPKLLQMRRFDPVCGA